MKRRPDWSGEREERRERILKEMQERRRERRKKSKIALENTSVEERAELVAAYDTLAAVVAEMETPEAQRQAAFLRMEWEKAIEDLTGLLIEAEFALAEKFGHARASVPCPDEDGETFWMYFDGDHLQVESPSNNMRWTPIQNSPLRVRKAVAHALHDILSALAARRWMTPDPPRNRLTSRSITELEV